MSPFTSWFSNRVGRSSIKRWYVLYGIGVCFLWFNYSHSPSTASHPLAPGDGLAQQELPKVDRSILEKVKLLEIHEGSDEEQDADESALRNRVLDRPPRVAEIPETEKFNPLAPVVPLEKVPADVLDYQVCRAAKGHGCQFIVPAWLGEQETKAQQHLYQLGLLALATNRTLVLPNVSKSRLGTCYRHPFSFYYSPDSLSSLGIPTISQEDFLLWSLQRDPPPSAQVVSVITAKPGVYPEGAVEIDSFGDAFAPPSKPNRNLCLRSPRSKLDFNSHSPLAIYPPDGFHKSETGRLGFGQSLIDTISSQDVATKSSRKSSSNHYDYSLPDVYAFNYEMRFSILTPESVVSHLSTISSSPSSSSSDSDLDSPSSLDIVPPLAFSHFPYSDLWSLVASSITRNLSPFIAIHWRTETLTPSNLSPCSESLLSKVFLLKEKYPEIRNVYLATDYPIEQLDPTLGPQGGGGGGEVAHSGTFAKVITEQHHTVMRKFLRGFESRSKRLSRKGGRGGLLRLTTFAKEQNELSLDPEVSNLPRFVLDQLVNLTSTTGGGGGGGSEDEIEDERGVPTLDLGALDSGLLGILDKLIVTQSQIFLTGVPGVGSSTVGACAKLSSFTQQLIGAREELISRQQQEEDGHDGERRVDRLWNTVQHWSLNGDEVD